MKHIKHWVATIAMLFCCITVNGHDFEVGGIYYRITSSDEVEVTFQGDFYNSNLNEYSGTLTIPVSVTYDGVEYKVTAIGDDTFCKCSSLSSVTLPAGLISIGDYAFSECSSLTSIILSKSVTTIGERAFENCSSLTSIIIPEGMTSIGDNTFYNCSSLTSIILSKSVTTIGERAFENCSSLTSITLPDGLISIGNFAFGYCSSLTSIIIPEGMTSIGDYTFYKCSNLTSITLPKGLISIGDYAFCYCSSLTTINIPESVTSIGGDAFSRCSSLTSVTIPENVTSIGDSAFSSCSSLASITLPKGLTSIGDYTFYGCVRLASISIPQNVTYIGVSAFKECSRLASITCYAVTPPTGDYASFFSGDWSIPVYVPVTSVSAYQTADYWKEFTNIQPITSGICGDNLTWKLTEEGELIIEGTGAMYDYGLYENNIPWYELREQIRSIKLHEGLTSICNNAFRYCRGFTFITIPESVTNIGDYVFHSCNLTAITIPKSVISIGIGLFSGCNNLTEIMVAEGNTVYDSRNDCNAIIETRSNTLIAGRSTAVIPESVTSIGERAFSNSINLSAISIPKSVTSIGYGAFRWCDILTSVTLPENVTEIGELAFAYCSNLTSIACKAMTPPLIHGTTFSNVDKSIPVYVPAESVGAYKTAEYWSEFTNIQPIASELPSVVYLKNVGSGKFLTAANWWGTCASLGEHGLDMTLAQLPNGKYTIDTQIKGSESNYFLGKIGEKLYMDATSTEWMIEDQGNGRYTLSLDGTYYMGFDGTSVVSENLTNSADANAQWQLLTREDLITEMKYATMASPVDATFYIRGANFSRQDLRNSAWIGEPSIGGEDENFCAEKWNSGVCTVYQELKDLPNGVYKLKTQGFYRMGGHDVAVNHRNEGTENYDVKFFANDASVPVMSVMDEAGKLSDVGVAYGNYGNAPSDRAHATQFFNKGYYQHEFYFTVTDGTAVVGIVNNSGLLDDWMCFDNFELYYCGEAAVIIDSQASYSQVEDKQCASITYTRNFKNTNWQALYVPFEIPLTEDFLADFEIAYINDVHQFDDDNNGDIDRTEVEAIKKVGGTLEANYPYLIRAKVAGEKQIVVTDAMLYAAEENSIDCSSVFNSYTFTGTYKKIPAVQLPKEEGYYAMSGGDWKQYSSGATSSLGAFRIYMKIDSRNENMKAQAHTIKMRVVGCDDEADDVTGIDDSQLTMDNSPLVIYDMQGRRITDMANLKGVYIVNGKKVVY